MKTLQEPEAIDLHDARNPIVGREEELASIAAFVRSPAGDPVGLRLEGDPGIGKTVLWEAGVSLASDAGYRVLRARPSGSETNLSLSVLLDLLGDALDDILPRLSKAHRNTIEIALLNRELSDDADGGNLPFAVLATIDELAKQHPLVVAIDDAQWIDASSAPVLAFALRRAAGERVRLLCTSRRGLDLPVKFDEVLGRDRVVVQEVGPLGEGELGPLIRARLDLSLPLPTLERIREASGGNPFYALEFARSFRRGGDTNATEALELPKSLEDVINLRLSSLSDDALEALLIAAMVSQPTVDLVHEVMADPHRADTGMAEAETAEIVAISGDRISFTHPLLSAAVYSQMPRTKRRLMHRHLADVVTDTEEQAIHLALGTVGKDHSIALRLEAVATELSQRAAISGAARVMDEALRLLPPHLQEDRHRLLGTAAKLHFGAGDGRRAKALLEELIAGSRWGIEKADAMKRLAAVLVKTDGVQAASDMYREALEHAEEDPDLVSDIEQSLAWMACWIGSVPGTYHHARKAYAIAKERGDGVVLMNVLATLGEAQFHMGMDDSYATMERALELEKRFGDEVACDDRPSFILASHLHRADRLSEAREIFLEAYEREVAAGDQGNRIAPQYQLAQIELATGNLDLAERHAQQVHEAALQTGQELHEALALFALALVDGHRGEDEIARARTSRLIEMGEKHNNAWAHIRGLTGVVFLELGLGHNEAAVKAGAEAAEMMRATEVKEPGSFHLLHNYAEALINLGRLVEAEQIIDELQAQGEARRRAWALGAAARCRGLLSAANSDLEAARDHIERSVAIFEATEYPLELSRSLTALGTVLRRMKQKKAAREVLQRSLDLATKIGATQWVRRAEAEMRRIGGRTAGIEELTPTEEQVAALIEEGLSNKETADRLSMTVRGVESNLTKIYRKLQVRSRTEMISARRS